MDLFNTTDNFYSLDYKEVDSIRKPSNNIEGSGGSCFPAGTLIKTSHGYRPIEKMFYGQSVISYDKQGYLVIGIVVQTPIHKVGSFQDDLYFLVSEDGHELFPKGITGNHAVLTSKSVDHKQVKDLTVGEELLDLDDVPHKISSISITPNSEISDDVYNLIVEPTHTYLAGSEELSIRVHNGGGGKSGDSARQPQEAPNTLQSRTMAKILEIVSHGEIVGILGGAKGVLLNNTAIQNTDDTYNFENVIFDQRVGTPSQTHIPGFSNVEAEVAIAETEMFFNVPVVEQLPSSNVDAARVTFKLPEGLWKRNAASGDLVGNVVRYKIETKERSSGTWAIQGIFEVDDKTTGAWEIAYRIQSPIGAVQWDIRVTKETADDVDATSKSKLFLTRITEIFEETLSYDNIAYAGLFVSAESVGNNIPTRSYLVQGIKVQVPDIYDTVLRTYGTSYWTGLFKTEFTDNTAWVLYDLIVNPEYGMENFLAQSIKVDIWSFFEASLYNDAAVWDGVNYIYTLLDDGEGGLEVRHTFNTVIQTQKDAWQLLHAVASNMKCVLVMKGDEISLIQDKPKTAVRLFNNSNVVGRLFTYSGSEAPNRATSINCTFNDKLDRHLPRVITEEDSVQIDKFGFHTEDIVAYGVTSESEARRKARDTLYNQTQQSDKISFAVAFNIIDISVGDLIEVMDDDYIFDTTDYLTGRVASIAGTTVILGNAVTLITGHTYTFGVMDLDYTNIIEGVITTPASVTDTLQLDITLPVGDYSNHEFFCYSSGFIVPKKFLVQSIQEPSRGSYALTCLEYSDLKYPYIESGLVIQPPDNIILISPTLPPVENIVFSEVFLNTGISSENHIGVSWDWDEANPSSDQVLFIVKWRRDSGVFTTVQNIVVKSFELPSVVPGIYEVHIEVQNLAGKRSLSRQATYDYRTVGSPSTLIPPENFFVRETAGVIFTGKFIALSWTFPIANASKSDILLDYVLEAWSQDGVSKKSTFIILPDSLKGGNFDYTFDLNETDFTTPVREVQFRLYSRDMVGDVSVPVIANFTNPLPAAPVFTLVSGISATYINITPPLDRDLLGYIIYRSTTQGFTPGPGDIEYDGVDSSSIIPGDPATTYYFVIAAYDAFGKVGLNLSAENSSTTINSNLDIWIFDSLTFKPNDPSDDSVSWTAGTASKNGAVPVVINAGNSAWTSGILYLYYSGTGNTLSATNDLAVAVTGVIVLATYKGGTELIVGNGNSFMDGGLLLANTVGANQLVVDTAIITNVLQLANAIIQTAHIQDGSIINVKIGDTIQSSNWNPATFTGWKIDKTGNIVSYGALELRDAAGNIVLTTGLNAQIEWDAIGGLGKAADNADVTADKIPPSSVNIMVPPYSNWEVDELPPMTFSANGVPSLDKTTSVFGSGSLKSSALNVNAWMRLSASNTTYNISMSPNKTWIASAYIRCSIASGDCQIGVQTATATYMSGLLTSSPTLNLWTRVSFLLDLTSDNNASCFFRVDNESGVGNDYWFDGLQLQEYLGGVSEPSSYSTPSDVTYASLAGSGVNIMAANHSSFENDTLAQVTPIRSTAELDTTDSFFGQNSLKVITVSADPYIVLAESLTDYSIQITPNRKWLVSLRIKSSLASADGFIGFRTPSAGFIFSSFTQNPVSDTWTLISVELDMSADSSTNCNLRIDLNNAGTAETVNIDGVMVEEKVGALSDPSSYNQPGTVGAEFDKNIKGQITSGNIEVYVAALAVSEAYIANLSVSTLKLQDQSVTIPIAIYTDGPVEIPIDSYISASGTSLTVNDGSIFDPGGGFGKIFQTGKTTIDFEWFNSVGNVLTLSAAAITTIIAEAYSTAATVVGECLCQTAVINSTGNKIAIQAEMSLPNSKVFISDFNLVWRLYGDYRVYRDDILIHEYLNAHGIASSTLSDTPGGSEATPVTFTYKVRFIPVSWSISTLPFFAQKRFLSLTETKK